jgi:hypothetical protein
MAYKLRLYRNSEMVGTVVFYTFPVRGPTDYLCEPNAVITHDEAVSISYWLHSFCAQSMGRIGDLLWQSDLHGPSPASTDSRQAARLRDSIFQEGRTNVGAKP